MVEENREKNKNIFALLQKTQNDTKIKGNNGQPAKKKSHG